MDKNVFINWTKRFPGIILALKNISNDRKIWADGRKIVSISDEPISLEFLITSPIDEMYNEYVSPRIYAVLGDGQCRMVLGEEEYLQVCAVPFALHFLKMKQCDDVEYVVYTMRSGWSKIDDLDITIFTANGFNLKFTAMEIEAAFENGNWQGIEDLKSRFTTGVGLGRATADRAEVLNHQEVGRRAILAVSIFNQRLY